MQAPRSGPLTFKLGQPFRQNKWASIKNNKLGRSYKAFCVIFLVDAKHMTQKPYFLVVSRVSSITQVHWTETFPHFS